MSGAAPTGAPVDRTDLGCPQAPDGALVDVVIACHSPRRPLGRAVASVLEGNAPAACVTVVSHNLDAAELAAVIGPAHRDRVRYLELHDGIPSPSGPFNAGIAQARTPWVSIMGSDDQLCPGAVESWLALARATGAELVIPRLALGEPGATVPTPAVRWTRLLAAALSGSSGTAMRRLDRLGRLARTDLVADRLSYRSAPLGLMSLQALGREGIGALVPGLSVGEDVSFMTQMLSALPTAYDAVGPAYLIGEDAQDRVTYEIRPIDEQLAFLIDLVAQDWFAALGPAQRRAVIVKMVRIHVFGAVHYRDRPEHWSRGERRALAAIIRALHRAAPGYARVLSVAETGLLAACLDPGAPAAELIEASRRRRRHGSLRTLVTPDPVWMLDREAPLRFMAASVLTKALPALLAAVSSVSSPPTVRQTKEVPWSAMPPASSA